MAEYSIDIDLPANDAVNEDRTVTLEGDDLRALQDQARQVAATHVRAGKEAYTRKISGGTPIPQGFQGPLDPDKEEQIAAQMGQVGAGDAALTLGSSILATPIAGLAGAGAAAVGGTARAINAFRNQPNGTWGNINGYDAYTATASALTHKPVTSTGEDIIGGIGKFGEDVSNFMDTKVNPWLGGADDRPIWNTVLKTGESLIAQEVGAKLTGGGSISDYVTDSISRGRTIGQIKAELRDKYGIELGSGQIKEQIAAAAEGRIPAWRGQELTQMADQLDDISAKAKEDVDKKFEDARGIQAGIRAQTLQEWTTNLKSKLLRRGIDPESNPKLKRNLDAFANISDNENASLRGAEDPGTQQTMDSLGLTTEFSEGKDPRFQTKTSNLTLRDANGDEKGFVTARDYGAGKTQLQITDADMHPSLNGKGLEPAMFDRVISKAFADGKTRVVSGTSVDPAESAVYTSLRNRGYDVELNTTATAKNGKLVSTDGKPVYQVKAPAVAKLDYIESMRTNLNDDISTASGPELKGLVMAKRQLDDLIDKQFNQDMVVGDPSALQAWKDAYKARKDYADVFETNKTIKKLLADQEASGSDIKRWILGANSIGGKTGSLSAVRYLQQIFGKDSPQIVGLGKEMALDVALPLMKENPDLAGFVANYDKVMVNNREVVNALDPFAKSGLDDLYKVSKAVLQSGGEPKINFNVNRMVAQMMFGHEIAKAAMRRSLAEMAIEKVRGQGAGQARAQMRALLGYDPYKPLAPKGSLISSGIIHADQEDNGK